MDSALAVDFSVTEQEEEEEESRILGVGCSVLSVNKFGLYKRFLMVLQGGTTLNHTL